MIYTKDLYSIKVNDLFRNVRKYITASIFLSLILGGTYLIFWLGVMSSEFVLEYGRTIFSPLATFLNPNDSSYQIYLKTGLDLFLAIIPLTFLYYVADKIEADILNKHDIELEKQRQKTVKKAKQEYLSQFDEIKHFSICLSIDYLSKNNSEIQKDKINLMVLSKIKKELSKVQTNAKISLLENVLIITSSDFSKYDLIYDDLLKLLSKIKMIIEAKGDIEMTPSITTDADKTQICQESDEIIKNHFNIQSFNFKNRATASALFVKKYQHINKNKYMGTPMGEYASFEGEKMKSYELNMIFKNLNQTLLKIEKMRA